MTQEEKDLLLKDLCARLPYGVKCENSNHVYGKNIFKVTDIRNNGYISGIINNQSYWDVFDPLELKPYLFPLSSMTEEQWNNAPTINLTNFTFESFKCKCFTLASYTCENDLHDLLEFINWLIANHFDIYGLIPKGLAIDATGKGIY